LKQEEKAINREEIPTKDESEQACPSTKDPLPSPLWLAET